MYNKQQLKHIEECESTQELAKQEALQSKNKNTLHWVSATKQSKGRGRQGRIWLTAEDSLLCSVSFYLPESNHLPQWISLLAGWSLYQVALNTIEDKHKEKLLIKWPNDLCIKQEQNLFKLAGILCESRAGILCIGWGLNIKGKIDLETAASLDSYSTNTNTPQLYEALRTQFQNDLNEALCSQQKATNILEKIKSIGMNKLWGMKILYNQTTKAKALDLNQDGNLKVELENGTQQTLQSGEIWPQS